MPRQKTLAVLALVVALVLEIVDLTIVNTALPAIKNDLAASAAAAEWVVAGYALSFATMLLLGGRLGDVLGYRRMFLGGVAGFTLASMLCGMAPAADTLVAARLLQGAAAAMMAPQIMAFMQVLFDPLERVSKMALFGVIGGLSAIVGPILGGVLIHADVLGMGWRLIFLINGPVGLAALVAGWRYLPAGRSARAKGIDWAGVALFAAGIAGLVWPAIAAEQASAGWGTALAPVAALAALVLGWRHVRRRAARGAPVLFDPALLRAGPFRLGLMVAAVFSMANGGFLLIFAFALQNERGLTPLDTGLYHVPFSLGVMIGIGGVGRRFLPRFGRWVPVVGIGLLALAGGVVLAGVGALGWALPWLAPLVLLAGMGMGMAG
ncbi:MAG TPA: MFS transporter, partial [Novosphingobium sp.]|nr:MFS transporter [Novosphingobium sp.]